MDTADIKLSVREALESSLSFLGEFLKQHWVLVLIYVVIATFPAFIIGDQDPADISFDKKLQLGVVTLMNIIPGLLMIYYPLRDALLKLDTKRQISKRSVAASLCYIFCINVISVIIGIPLLCLLIIPGFWWSTKASVSYANLLGTEDGPIQSIRRSHQLMNGRFWQSLGFLVATASVVAIISVIAIMTIGFFLLIGGLLNALFHEGAGLNKVMMIFRIIGPIISVFTATVMSYYQAWLYVYLKSQSDTAKAITL